MKPSRPKEQRQQEQIDRGLAAGRLIEDQVVIDWFGREERRLVEAMVSAPVDDDGTRRTAAVTLKLLKDLRSHLSTEATLGRREQEKAKSHG
jgi:hypothetical protein